MAERDFFEGVFQQMLATWRPAWIRIPAPPGADPAREVNEAVLRRVNARLRGEQVATVAEQVGQTALPVSRVPELAFYDLERPLRLMRSLLAANCLAVPGYLDEDVP